jgi:hypothetical protein
VALHLALGKMNGWSWQVLPISNKVGTKMGVNITNNGKVLMRWHQMLHEKWMLILPLQNKNNLPAFLDLNPHVCNALQKFAPANLSQLGCTTESD